jgi:translation initiation factor IF-2
MQTQTDSKNLIERPPVIAVMGHVDHGKSTLLDYIRKTNVVDSETGGITQKVSAYEVNHVTPEGREKRITFLDTPGHEAFTAIRSRGAKIADIAILVVAAEDGVRPQTIEALNSIKKANVPFIVAINKIDKEGADIEKTKLTLAEAGVYVEGFGGDVPFVPISAKTGQGVSELLDIIMLVADLQELKGDPTKTATGAVLEANLDRKKGIAATLIIKDGTLKSGSFVSAGTACAPVRIMENFLGKQIKEATFSSPIRIIGWTELPAVGAPFSIFSTKKEAEECAAKSRVVQNKTGPDTTAPSEEMTELPIVLKASEAGGLDAMIHEVKKIQNEKIKLRLIASGVGDITENDIKSASGKPGTIIIGFNVKADNSAKSQAEKLGIEIQVFDIIYKLSEWLTATVIERAPKTRTEEATGQAKIIRLFSKLKDRQVVGGRMETGVILLGAEVKIMRRDFEVGKGRVRELQRLKNKVSEVPEGQEFGALVESKIEIAPGDKLQAFKVVEK